MFYISAVPPARMALDRAQHLLDIAQGSVTLLSARLAPDMMNAGDQIRTVAGFALRTTYPLTDRPIPRASFSNDPRGLRAELAFANAAVDDLSPADFDGAADRRIRHTAGEAQLDQSALDYLTLFALPNLWFHLSMAYAILWSQGAPIGKADFDGLHHYSR